MKIWRQYNNKGIERINKEYYIDYINKNTLLGLQDETTSLIDKLKKESKNNMQFINISQGQNFNLTTNEIKYSSNTDDIFKQWSKAVDAIITEDDVDFLEESNLERFFKSTIERFHDGMFGNILIEKYYVKNANNDLRVLAILHAISHLNYEDIEHTGTLIAGACLPNKNIEIVEFALKAFENWGDKTNIEYLETVSLSDGWLQNYISEIIEYLQAK